MEVAGMRFCQVFAAILAMSLSACPASAQDYEFEFPDYIYLNPDDIEYPEWIESIQTGDATEVELSQETLDSWLEPWNEPEGNGMSPDEWFQNLGQGLADELGLQQSMQELWEEDPEGLVAVGAALGIAVLAADAAGVVDLEGELQGLGDIDLPELPIYTWEIDGGPTIEFGLGGGDFNIGEETANPVWALTISEAFENGNSVFTQFTFGTPLELDDGIKFENPLDFDANGTIGVDVGIRF